MENNNKDNLFQILKDKLLDYDAMEATDADWDQFSQRYQSKKSNGFWFKVIAFVGVVIIAILGLLLSSSGPIKQQMAKPTQQQSTTKGGQKQRTEFTNKSTVINQSEGIKPPNQTKENTLANRRDEQENNQLLKEQTRAPVAQEKPTIFIAERQGKQETLNPLTQKGPEKAQITEVMSMQNLYESNINSTEQPLILYRKPNGINTIESHVSTIPKSDFTLKELNPINKDRPTDSTKYVLPKAKPHKWYIDAGGLLTQGIIESNNPFSEKWFNGGAIALGRNIGRNWQLAAGVQYGNKRETSVVVLKESHIETEIVRIDTFLRFLPSANRIMMQMDTVTQSSLKESISPRELYSNQTWVSIPFTIHYFIGNEKRKIIFNGGVHSVFSTVESTQLIKTQQKESVSFSQERYLFFASTIGVGVYQRVFKQLGIQLNGDYLYYLPNKLTTQQSFQIRAGIRFNF